MVAEGGHRRKSELLAAVGVVVVADGVDFANGCVCAGSLLSRGGLGVMRDGGPADLGGAAVVEVLEAAGGGEGCSRAPVGEASYGVRGGTAAEETGHEASESKGGYFEEAAGSAGGFTGGHGSVSEARIRSKCRTSGDCNWWKVNFDGSDGQ